MIRQPGGHRDLTPLVTHVKAQTNKSYSAAGTLSTKMHSIPNCHPILRNHSKSHIRQNQTNTTRKSHNNVLFNGFQRTFWSTYSRLIVAGVNLKGSNGSFRHWQVSGLTISRIAACFSCPNVHSVDCASFKPLRSQHNRSRLIFWASLVPYHNFKL